MGLPGVRDAVGSATAAVERVHTSPANRRGWARSAAAASVRAARASAALDGAPIAVDTQSEVVSHPVLAGALRVAAELPSLLSVWTRAPWQALARFHVLAAADLSPEAELGRPRIGDGARLAGLADVVRAAPWPGAVTAGIVLAELVSLAPFPSANGVVARAAARLTLASSGLDPRGLTVYEVGWLRASARTEALLAGYADGTGIADWLVGFGSLLEAGAREGMSIAAAAG